MNINTYVLLRLAIGTSMFGHGMVRLPKLMAFSNWMVGNFEKSMLPQFMVKPFSIVLPIAECTIGLLLLLGLFTQPALVTGGIVMLLLIFGTCIIENWEALSSQLIHVFFFAILIQYISSNSWALDSLLKK